MQTIYILKNDQNSFKILKQLYTSGNLAVCIIIVNKFHSKILKLDKRVTEFPFIINTLPTSIGLIPKIAVVTPLVKFMKKQQHNYIEKPKKKKTLKEREYKTITYTPNNNPQVFKNGGTNLFGTLNSNKIHVNNHDLYRNDAFTKKSSKPVNKNRKPIIKTRKDNDGGVSIILQ